jgi:hypothetical protein
MASTYRFSSAFTARLLGTVLVAVGVLVLVLALLVALLDLPGVVLLAGVLVGLAALLATGVLLRRGADVVSLGEEGYRVRLVRGAGVTAARWTDVEDVAATVVDRVPCVVVRLRDGRTTTIPAGVLAGSPDDFVRDLQQHLNRGHGYRPVR